MQHKALKHHFTNCLLFCSYVPSSPFVSQKFQSSKEILKKAPNLNAKLCHGFLTGKI